MLEHLPYIYTGLHFIMQRDYIAVVRATARRTRPLVCPHFWRRCQDLQKMEPFRLGTQLLLHHEVPLEGKRWKKACKNMDMT